MNKGTGGEVTIELMKAPLAPPPGQYDLVKNGAVDIAYGIAAFRPKRFNLYRGMEMPFMFNSAEAASTAHWEWIKENGIDEKEFGDTKLIATLTHAPFLVHSTKPLMTLADFNGMKVRAGGTGIEIFKRLGAAPVFIPPGGTTEAIERGTVDATQFTWESLLGFRLIERANHHLEIPNGLYGTAFWIAMSKRSWDKLTPEQHAAIEGMGLSGSKLIDARWDAVEGAGRKAATDNGNTITTLSDADTAKLQEITAFVDVVGRYFFNAPIIGSVEIISLMMGLVVFLGLGLATFEDGDIRVDIVTQLLPRKARLLMDVFAHLLSLGIAGLMSWRLTIVALDQTAEMNETQVLALPIWAVALVMAACSTLLVIGLGWHLSRALRAFKG